MKPHHVLMLVGVILVGIAFVKFSFIGYQPEEGAAFAGVAILGAGALGLSDLIKGRMEGWGRSAESAPGDSSANPA